MDPVTAAGIILSVVRLFPLCAQGFTIIQDGFKANKGDVSKALTMIYIHSGTFTAWGEWWGIGPSAQPRTAGQKTHLQKYIESSKTVGPAVKATLIAISNKFAGVQDLEKSYGIKIRGEDIGVDMGDLDVETVVKGEIRTNSPGELKKRAKHMNILKRAKFVLKDSKGLEKLSVQLSQYIDALMKMCSEHAAERVERAMLSQVLAERNLPQDLQNIVVVAKQESARKRDDDQRYATYDLLASTAAFKAKIRDSHPDVYLNQEDYRYWETGRDWDYNNRGGTVAVHGKDDFVCYIEWKYYRIINGEDNANDIKDIEKLAHMLSDEDKPAELRTLTCFGIFKDSIHPRYGLVYQPPKYIEEPPRGWQSGAISKLRKPVSLFQLLKNSISPSEATNVLDLGVRFQLAKQLVQSTYLLHAAGWVHKNIRSASVLFLPSESRLGGPSTTGQKDFGTPWLSGFGHSRWEDPVNDPGHSYYGIPDSAGGYQSLMRTQQMASINLDFYHHPDKRNNPLLRYRPSHDVYSLGCVLLEIGLWQDLDSFHKFYYTPDKFRAVLLDLTNDLVGQTGSKYAAAVRECLAIDSTDRVTSGKEALHILCWKVSAMLDGCSA